MGHEVPLAVRVTDGHQLRSGGQFYLLNDLIFERDAFRAILREPCIGSCFAGKDLDVVDIADFLAGVDVNPNSDVRSEAIHARPSIASLTGFSHRTITSRWQRASRSRSSAPNFNLRLARASTVEGIMILIREASSRARGWRGGDDGAHRIVVAQKLAARRKLGRMLVPPQNLVPP